MRKDMNPAITVIIVLTALLWPGVAYGAFPDSLDLGDLKPGQKVTITFKVTVGSNVQAGIDKLANQGTVSGSNFTSVDTDDPDAAGTNDPTETPLDNPEPVYDFSAATYTVGEGDNPNTTLVVKLARSIGINIASQVDAILAAGAGNPAIPGTDFTAGAVTVNFGVGETIKDVPIEILGDFLDEFDENVSLLLANFLVDGQPAGEAGTTHPAAVLSIQDDDPPPSLSVTDTTVSEGTSTMDVTINLSTASGLDVEVDYTTADGSAQAGSDYAAAANTLTIPAGKTAGTVAITIIDDALQEDSETFEVILSNPVNAVIADASAVLRISDNDTPGIILTPTSAPTTTEGGGQATFSVRLASEPNGDVVIDVLSTDSTEGNISPAGLTFTGANWNTNQTVTVTGVDDDVLDGDQGYSIQLTVNAGSTTDTTGYEGLDPDDVSVTNTDDEIPSPGDINGDERVTLKDLILVLQVCDGIAPAEILWRQSDVNGDGKLGMEEAVYILKEVSDVR